MLTSRLGFEKLGSGTGISKVTEILWCAIQVSRLRTEIPRKQGHFYSPQNTRRPKTYNSCPRNEHSRNLVPGSNARPHAVCVPKRSSGGLRAIWSISFRQMEKLRFFWESPITLEILALAAEGDATLGICLVRILVIVCKQKSSAACIPFDASNQPSIARNCRWEKGGGRQCSFGHRL